MDIDDSLPFWLPTTFVLEVLGWEIGSRVGLVSADSDWVEFGRFLHVEQASWALAGLSAALLLLVGVTPLRGSGAVGFVQVLGVVGLFFYWVGSAALPVGLTILACTFATMVLQSRQRKAAAR